VIIDAQLVSKVAKLASLELSPGERDRMAEQLTRIVEHFEELRSIPAEELEEVPVVPPTPYREDSAVPARLDEVVARNAPEFSHGHFVVPRVVSRGE
jgi:aspartyl-tRNA(Asn)/glutamyl-tRNA(Gln) amidotransferase subunit C